MEYYDKKGKPVKDSDALLFTHEDKMEESGHYSRVTQAKLCFYSSIEKRWIPFEETYDDSEVIKELEIIKNDMP